MKFNFTLEESQANLVLEVLATAPYGRVVGLIAELQKQAAPQINPTPVAEEKTAE